ncbi:MAG: tetratricopeptide repeat protein [Lachnospiraceae bacterium]|nr:tetratricopeptide repeat protein [Lachnospiraceae bacterium]
MFCGRCGKELKEGAAFCANCGAPIQQTVGPEAVVQRMVQVETPVQQVPPIVGQTEKEKKAEKTKKKGGGKKGKRVVIAAAALLAVALAAAGITGVILYFTGDTYQCGKNLAAADKLYEDGQYEEALASYAEVLKLNAGLVEPYLRSADIYLSKNAYSDAIKLLNRGNRRTNWQEPEIDGKLEETYLRAAQYYMESKEYGQAYTILDQGILDTDSAELPAQKVRAYLAEEAYYLESGAYEQALQVLEIGVSDTGDISLEQEKVRIYILMADASLQAGDYGQALIVLNRGISRTGDASLEEEKVRVYRTKSDRLLEEGEYPEAVQALVDGEQDTDSAQLRERETYLRENIVITQRFIYNYGNLYSKAEYDAAGKLSRETIYFSGGAVYSVTEYAYGGDGLTMTGTGIYYDEFGNAVSRFEVEETLDAQGKMVKENLMGYSANGSLIYHSETENTYTYENDTLVRCDTLVIYYDEYGEYFRENTAIVYTFEESGSQKATWYDSTGAVTASELTLYDERGNMVEVQGTFYSGGSAQRWWYNSYNILGDPVTSSSSGWWYDGDRYSYEYMYEYAYTGQ